MLRFNITGSELSFQEIAAKKVLWELPEGAAQGQWHRIITDQPIRNWARQKFGQKISSKIYPKKTH